MTTNINWTPRERDVVLQMAVYLYKHGRLRFDRPTHNEAWRKAMLVLPVDRRRNFTSASNLGRIYELYMGMLTDEAWVNLPSEIAGHCKLEFPDYMVLADRIDSDMIQRFGATLDTAFHVPRQKKLSPQEQMEFLYKEIERLQHQVTDLTHAFETHTHGSEPRGQQWSPGNHEQAEARIDRTQSGQTRYCYRKAGTSNAWEELPHEQWLNLRTSVHYETRAFDGEIPKPRWEVIKGRAEGGDFVLTDAGKALHHRYPLHVATEEDKPAPEDTKPAHIEGDGIGDDPGAEYDPENYSDMEPEPIVVGNLDVAAVTVDAPAMVIEPEVKPAPADPNADRAALAESIWRIRDEVLEEAGIVTTHLQKAASFDPIRDNHGVFDEKPAVVPEPDTSGPVLYFYGCPARLRPSLGQFLSKCPIKIRTVHLDEGGKLPLGDVPVLIINFDWIERPSGRVKLIEQNVTKPRYVDGGWTSIIEGVRAALQDYYGLSFAE